MHLTWRDGVATVLVAAVVAPFVGYMASGAVPVIEDPTGMAGLALAIGVVAAAVGGWIAIDSGTIVRSTTYVVAAGAFVLGWLALLSESFFDVATREGLLIAFMAAVVLLWVVALARHAGLRFGASQPQSRASHA